MALTFVQSKSAKDETTTDDSPTVTLTTAPPQGDLLVIEIAANEQAAAVSISLPGGWTVIPTNGTIDNASNVKVVRAWKQAGAGESATITANLSVAAAWAISVCQFHDSAGGGWVYDVSAKNTGSSTTPTTGTTGTTASAAAVAVAGFGTAKQATFATPTNGFTLQETQVPSGAGGNFAGIAQSYKILAATGTQSTGLTLGTSRAWAAGVGVWYAVVPPANTVAPVASGTAVVGNSLSTTNGSWSGTSPTFTYQWQRDNLGGGVYSNIPGATANSYTLVDADDDCRVRCVVTGTNLGGSSSANSNALGPVDEPAPSNTIAPVIGGVGIEDLAGSDGTWLHMGGHNPAFTYQWQRSATGVGSWSNITGATSATYTVQPADVNKYVRLVVTATNTGGNASANSNVILSSPVAVGLVVEMAFGDGPATVSPTWVDVTNYVRAIPKWDRGRQNELNQMQAGTGSMLIRDFASDFDPRNPDGAFYPNVRPGTPVRAYITMGFITFPLFRMVTERQPRTLRVTDKYTERQIDMVDGFALLANAGISGMSYVQQSSDARFNAVLDDVGWPSDMRQIGPGESTVVAATIDGDAGESAQAHLLTVNESENGLFFCNGNGDVVLVGRHDLIQVAGYTESQATFRDAIGSSGHVYHALSPSFDVDNVINRAIGTRPGGTPQIAEDAASQDQYFQRERQFASLVTTDAEVLNQMQWKVGQFAQPLDRVESIVVHPFRVASDLVAIQEVISREIGDRITVLETPPGFAAEESNEYTIQHLAGSIPAGTPRSGPNALAGMTLTFLLWPAATVSFWVAGDPVQSLAGVSTRPGY